MSRLRKCCGKFAPTPNWQIEPQKNKTFIIKEIRMPNQYPPFMQKAERSDPALFKVVADSHQLVMQPGALDAKTKLLIMVAVDAFAGSAGVKGIAAAARAAGATDTEIAEALRVAYYVAGNKALFTAMAAFEDQP
jgi:alkylhydroperoxidase/carboxymuconolactone decarboxylase family protein YurZ